MTRVTVLMNAAALATLPLWQVTATPAPREGAETPQAVVAAMQRAEQAQDWGATFALMLPSARHELAEPLLQSVALMVAMADPSSPLMADVPPAELETRRTAYHEATRALREAWAPYGLAPLVGRPPLAPATRTAMTATLARAQVPALMHDTMRMVATTAASLGIKDEDHPRVPPIGDVTGYTVTGDRATAKHGSEPVDFARVHGRWYFAPPAAK
jgi:hypothetical protein